MLYDNRITIICMYLVDILLDVIFDWIFHIINKHKFYYVRCFIALYFYMIGIWATKIQTNVFLT